MFSLIVTPRFGDIDGLGHVNNTVIPSWFEQARNQIYRYFNPDFSFKTWNLILARFEVDFVSQLFLDKDVEISTWISKIGRSSFEVYQEAWQEGKLGAKGKTVLVHFDFESQKSAEIPADIKKMLQEHFIVTADIKSN
jgi:acyl-CoA thioester hydrolase